MHYSSSTYTWLHACGSSSSRRLTSTPRLMTGGSPGFRLTITTMALTIIGSVTNKVTNKCSSTSFASITLCWSSVVMKWVLKSSRSSCLWWWSIWLEPFSRPTSLVNLLCWSHRSAVSPRRSKVSLTQQTQLWRMSACHNGWERTFESTSRPSWLLCSSNKNSKSSSQTSHQAFKPASRANFSNLL